jgi:hypothetical protein
MIAGREWSVSSRSAKTSPKDRQAKRSFPGSQRANVLETPPTHRAQVRPVHRTDLRAGGWQLWTRRYH